MKNQQNVAITGGNMQVISHSDEGKEILNTDLLAPRW